MKAMTIDVEKFRRTRKAAGLSQPALEKVSGVSQSTIDKIERGLTKESKMLPKLARALGVNVEDLLAPETTPILEKRQPIRFFSQDANMPVYGSAEGGNGHLIISTDALEYVPRPYTLDAVSDAYGIIIVGESMDPAFEPGDTAWVNPRLPLVRECDVILYSIDTENGEAKATIKRLVSWTDTEWTLRQHQPKKTFKLKKIEWPKCHRVVGKFSRR